MKLSAFLIAIAFALTGCSASGHADPEGEVALLRAEVAGLRNERANSGGGAPAPAPELGQQMLNLQIRHARLWAAGENENWILAHFQLAELNEALDDVAEQNGDHAALQPDRLGDVLPAIMRPAIGNLRAAIDAEDKAAFEVAYDGLSEACSACHVAADHGFLVMQRPSIPFLDNLKASPLPQ